MMDCITTAEMLVGSDPHCMNYIYQKACKLGQAIKALPQFRITHTGFLSTV